jgi:hypothetical protein
MLNKNKTIPSLALVGLVIVTVIIFIITYYINRRTKLEHHSDSAAAAPVGACSAKSCGAIDPVNDPDYNMRNVIKQSILLEEHIAEKAKYCMSCIVKHFNHIIGLVEEAVWLAGPDIDKYPYLDDSVQFYQSAFEMWLKGRDDDSVKKQTLALVREHRRKLIDAYFLAG